MIMECVVCRLRTEQTTEPKHQRLPTIAIIHILVDNSHESILKNT